MRGKHADTAPALHRHPLSGNPGTCAKKCTPSKHPESGTLTVGLWLPSSEEQGEPSIAGLAFLEPLYYL
jgi:hypothetical protein